MLFHTLFVHVWLVRIVVRDENYSGSCQCLCLCLGFIPTTASGFIFLCHACLLCHAFSSHPTCLVPPPPPSSTIKWTFPPPCCLCVHLLDVFSPARVYAPVWLLVWSGLVWSVWEQRRRKTRQVGRRWEELQVCEERASVVLPSGFSIGTQTSVQYLSGGCLLQMHILCSYTETFQDMSKLKCGNSYCMAGLFILSIIHLSVFIYF